MKLQSRNNPCAGMPGFGAILLASIPLLQSCSPVQTAPATYQSPTRVRFAAAVCTSEPYPLAAMNAKVTGKTVVQFDIDSKGTVSNAVVLKSAGETPQHKLLDEAARRITSTCIYPSRSGDATQTTTTTTTTDYIWKID